jgi:5-methyltetrahydrofolate--homocysteine methyltransferase
VSPDKFIETAKEKKADVVCMSALLTTTMPGMKDTIDAMVAAGVRAKHKVMIGGAPITQEYANQIKADGYAADAASAVDTAKQLLGKA